MTKAMKVWFVIMIAGAGAVAGVASAGSDPASIDEAAQTGETSTTVASAVPAVAGVGSTVATGPFEVTLLTVEDPVVPGEFFGPEPGNRYVGVELELRNTSEELQSFSTLLSAEVIDSQSQAWSTSLFAVSERSSIDGDIPAGEARRGWVGFEVPETSTGLRLFVDGDLFGDGEPATFALDAAAAPTGPTTTAAA